MKRHRTGRSRTHHEAFLEDIIAHPDEDAPRLIYADWLEEQGDPRAELIRIQCALAAGELDAGELQALRERERELLDLPGETWIGEISRWVESWELERGFLGSVRLSAQQLFRHGAALLQKAPLRELIVSARSDEALTLAGSPLFARVTGLEVRGHDLGDEGVESLLSSPTLGPLRTLILHHCGLGPRAARAITSAGLPLTLLNLGANDLEDAGAVILVSAPCLRELRVLGLGGNELRLDAAQALASSPCLRCLRRLNLGANYLTDDAIQALASSPVLATMEELDLRYNEFGVAGARALAGSPFLDALTLLDVTDNAIGVLGDQVLRRRFGERIRF